MKMDEPNVRPSLGWTSLAFAVTAGSHRLPESELGAVQISEWTLRPEGSSRRQRGWQTPIGLTLPMMSSTGKENFCSLFLSRWSRGIRTDEADGVHLGQVCRVFQYGIPCRRGLTKLAGDPRSLTGFYQNLQINSCAAFTKTNPFSVPYKPGAQSHLGTPVVPAFLIHRTAPFHRFLPIPALQS